MEVHQRSAGLPIADCPLPIQIEYRSAGYRRIDNRKLEIGNDQLVAERL